MSSYLYFNYCINVNFPGSSLGYKKLLFPRRVLLTCLTAILLSTKALCGSQSTLQMVLSRTCSLYQQCWPLGFQQHTLHLWGCGHLAVLAVPKLCQQCQWSEPKARAVSIPWALELELCRWLCADGQCHQETQGRWALLTDRKPNPCTSVRQKQTEQNQCLRLLLT